MEETCQIVPSKPETKKPNWQLICIIVGGLLLVLLLCYFFYRYILHTNKKFKVLEQAIHSLSEKTKQQNMVVPPPQLFMQQVQPPIVPMPPPPTPIKQQFIQPPQQPQVVVVDTKVLDKELSEELKELDTSTEPEGRVDTDTNNVVSEQETKPHT